MLEPGDPEYILRPGAFFKKYCNGGLRQFKYTSKLRKNDVFSSYQNSKWPWLVGKLYNEDGLQSYGNMDDVIDNTYTLPTPPLLSTPP